jgi:hypothetical protein
MAISAICWDADGPGRTPSWPRSRCGQPGLQLTYANTIQDLTMSLVGSFSGSRLSVTVLRPAANTSRTVFGWPTAGG